MTDENEVVGDDMVEIPHTKKRYMATKYN